MVPSDPTIKPDDGDEPGGSAGGGAGGGAHGVGAAAGGAARDPGAATGGLERPGDQIGPYKLLALLGEGGFGSVWLAERRDPFVQRVALKLIKAGMDSKSVLARFEQERQALAVMNHHGIARVLDGGITPSGRPYFAMEFVKGEPVTQFCDRVKLGIEERLKLFEQACEAIQHAHLKGIVHRDLKPGNVLAFMVEGEGPKLKVIDFGVAKAMSQRMTERTIFTETGRMIGTPEYMSPEQADPTSGDIDTRSDIYSLGVLLYELLVGATPFDGKELRKKAYGEIQRTLREQDPPSPSARLSTLSTRDREAISRIEAARKLRSADLVRRLRGELEWIPQKAMRKEPQHRYQTALEFANDVRAYLDGRPITAAPESTGYRLRKYARRNRALVAGGAAVFGTLVVGLGLATWQWAEANRARDEAVASEQRARELAIASEISANKAMVEKAKADELLVSSATGAVLDAIFRDAASATSDEIITDRLAVGDSRFPTRLAAALLDDSVGEFGPAHSDLIRCVRFSSGGQFLAMGGRDGVISLWDAEKGGPIALQLLTTDCDVSCVAFDPDGKVLAAGGSDSVIRVWDVLSGASLQQFRSGHRDGVLALEFSADGQRLVSGGLDGVIGVWNPLNGQLEKEVKLDIQGGVTSFAFSLDTGRVAVGCGDNAIRMVDLKSGEFVGPPMRGHTQRVNGIAISPSGTVLASGSDDATVRLWDPIAARSVGDPLVGHDSAVMGVSFSADGALLVSGGGDGKIRLWSATEGKQLGRPLRGHEESIHAVAFSPVDKTVVSGGRDGVGLRWDMAVSPFQDAPIDAHNGPINVLSSGPDGLILASGSDDRTVRLWDPLSGRALGAPLGGHETKVTRIAICPRSRRLVSGTSYVTLRLWDLSSMDQQPKILRGLDRAVVDVAFSRDGRVIAAASDKVLLWDCDNGRLLGDGLFCGGEEVSAVWFRPDERSLLAAGRAGVYQWNLDEYFAPTSARSGSGLAPLAKDRIVRWAFSPDGEFIAAVTEQSVTLFDCLSGQECGILTAGYDAAICSVALSVDGRTLVAGDLHGRVRFWDTVNRIPIGAPFTAHQGAVLSLGFSPDGSWLASGSSDQTIRLWHAVPMRDRIGPIRARLAQVDTIRAQLNAQIEAVGDSEADCAAFQDAVLADPRFAGDLRTAALIVVGEVSHDREAKRTAERKRAEQAQAAQRAAQEARLAPLQRAYEAKDWAAVLTLLPTVAPADLQGAGSDFWNEVAWRGLTELPADSPARDLRQLLDYAQRAVELSQRKDGTILDTLARAHWELGDKQKALEVQAEAIRALEAQRAAATDDAARTRFDTSITELRETLAGYERDQPPAPPKAQPAAPPAAATPAP